MKEREKTIKGRRREKKKKKKKKEEEEKEEEEEEEEEEERKSLNNAFISILVYFNVSFLIVIHIQTFEYT